MSVFCIEYPNLNFGVSECLVFVLPHGEKTAIVFAQHPDSKNGTSIINVIEKVAALAFQEIPEISSLDEDQIEFYSTLRFVARKDEDRKRKVKQLIFADGLKQKAKGFTLKKEWIFQKPEWEDADDGFVSIFNQAARQSGYPSE
jgi:hypothetical protein